MATDATGTPTSPDSIPTYATSADAPSGKGFNAAMASIQTALSARISKPATPATGDALVWSGSTWARASGTPSSTTFLRGDGSWAAAGTTTYRKTTTKAVNTTAAETDLLNSEITIAANAMGATGLLKFTAWGDYLQNSGGATVGQRFKLKLGATTLVDTGVPVGTSQANLASPRFGWRVTATILNSATNVQTSYLDIVLTQESLGSAVGGNSVFTTGEGTVNNLANVSTTYSAILYSGMGVAGAEDTTASKALVFSVINPSASATYETKLFGAVIEVV